MDKEAAPALENLLAGAYWDEPRRQPAQPPWLLEGRVLELERMGLSDEEPFPGMASSARRFALASLLHHKPPYFVTHDDAILVLRDVLECRYGLKILSIPEAIMLLHEANGPPN